MKNTLTILLLTVSSYSFSQEFDTDKYLKYDDKTKKIFWRIVGTARETQYFEILKKNKVNHFDGVKTKALYRINKKE